MKKDFTSKTQVIVGFRVRFDWAKGAIRISFGGDTNYWQWQPSTSGSNHQTMVYGGSTTYANLTGANNTTYHFEIAFLTDKIVVYRDDIQVMIRTVSTSSINSIKISFVAEYVTYWLDDVYILDGNRILGSSARVHTLVPDTNGTHQDWGYTAASAWQSVNEIDNSYIIGEGTDQRSTFEFTDIPSPSGKEVLGVQFHTYGHNVDADLLTIEHIIKNNGSFVAFGTDFEPPLLEWEHTYFDQHENPITSSDWTPTELNNIEMGLRTKTT